MPLCRMTWCSILRYKLYSLSILVCMTGLLIPIQHGFCLVERKPCICWHAVMPSIPKVSMLLKYVYITFLHTIKCLSRWFGSDINTYTQYHGFCGMRMPACHDMACQSENKHYHQITYDPKPLCWKFGPKILKNKNSRGFFQKLPFWAHCAWL